MVGKKLTANEFPGWFSQQPCARHIREVILHHTWRPSAAQYQGEATIQNIYRYHTQTQGWRDIGYHYLIGPNGDIWAGRPVAEDGAHVQNRNRGTIGVSLILDGDVEALSEAQRHSLVVVLRACLDRFKLTTGQLNFHRDYSPKSCPGAKMDKATVRTWVSNYGQEPAAEEEQDDAAEHPDVPPWAEADMQWAVEKGLLSRMADGSLQGYRPVTRAELAIVLRRLAKWLGRE